VQIAVRETLIPLSRRLLPVRLVRLRRGETVPALLPHRLASLPFGVGDHLRRPRSAVGCSLPPTRTAGRATAGAQIITGQELIAYSAQTAARTIR